MLGCRKGVPENISLECGCSVGKVGGVVELWWLVCVLEGVLIGKLLTVFRIQSLGGISILGTSEHHREQNM